MSARVEFWSPGHERDVLSIARIAHTKRLNWRSEVVNLIHRHPHFLGSSHLAELERFGHEWCSQVGHGWFRFVRLDLLEGRGEALIRVRLSSESDGRRLCKVVSGSCSDVAVGSSYLGSVIISIWGQLPLSGMVLLCQSCFVTCVKLRRMRD